MLIINGKLPALPRDSRSLAVPGILVRLGLEFASFPLTPPSPPGEGEFSHGSEEFERCSCSPRFFGFRSEAHDNKARPYYQSSAECFSLSLRERAGVRGNRTPAVLAAPLWTRRRKTARKAHGFKAFIIPRFRHCRGSVTSGINPKPWRAAIFRPDLRSKE
jgi:hypothetical protein